MAGSVHNVQLCKFHLLYVILDAPQINDATSFDKSLGLQSDGHIIQRKGFVDWFKLSRWTVQLTFLEYSRYFTSVSALSPSCSTSLR